MIRDKQITYEHPSILKKRKHVPLTFTRASVAYDYNGDEVAANTPRFKHRVPDVTVRNLLTGNQSDGGDTNNPELLTLNQRTGTDALGNTTGFLSVFPDDTTMESSTTEQHSGTRSLKVITPGNQANEGIITSNVTVQDATAYICGCWFKSDAIGRTIRLTGSGGLTGANFTITGEWQWLEITGTTTSTIFYPHVKNPNNDGAMTFYVDDLRLAKNDTTGFTGSYSSTISATGETSHQGYRSLKVVTPNVKDGEGVERNAAVSCTQGASYTFSARVKAPLGASMVIIIGGQIKAFTGTGEWQYVYDSVVAPSTTIGWYIRTATKQGITFYVDSLMLETGDTAHDWAYGGSSYSTYKTVQGCLIEEAHTNLLTANQSTGTDSGGDTTGFSGAGTVPATISSSTTQALQGTKSLKVVTSGTNTNEGVSTASVNIANTTAHTQTLWLHAPTGSQLKLTATNQGAGATTGTLVTGNGAWQQVTLTGTSSSTSTVITIATVGSAQAITFYVDMLQLTATAYPLSWTLGGTTMAAETLTVNSSVYDLTSGTIELEALTNDIIKTDGINNYLLSTADGDGNNQISLLDDSSNNLTITTKASDAATSVSYADSNLTSNTMFKVAAPYKSDKLKLFKDGTSVGTPLTSANLPTTKQTIYLGSKYDGTLQANTLIRNVVLTKQDRVDGAITNRSAQNIGGGGFMVDKNVSLVMPLRNDLRAYRVRA